MLMQQWAKERKNICKHHECRVCVRVCHHSPVMLSNVDTEATPPGQPCFRQWLTHAACSVGMLPYGSRMRHAALGCFPMAHACMRHAALGCFPMPHTCGVQRWDASLWLTHAPCSAGMLPFLVNMARQTSQASFKAQF